MTNRKKSRSYPLPRHSPSITFCIYCKNLVMTSTRTGNLVPHTVEGKTCEGTGKSPKN